MYLAAQLNDDDDDDDDGRIRDFLIRFVDRYLVKLANQRPRRLLTHLAEYPRENRPFGQCLASILLKHNHTTPTSRDHRGLPRVSAQEDIHIAAEWQVTTMAVHLSPIHCFSQTPMRATVHHSNISSTQYSTWIPRSSNTTVCPAFLSLASPPFLSSPLSHLRATSSQRAEPSPFVPVNR